MYFSDESSLLWNVIMNNLKFAANHTKTIYENSDIFPLFIIMNGF